MAVVHIIARVGQKTHDDAGDSISTGFDRVLPTHFIGFRASEGPVITTEPLAKNLAESKGVRSNI